MQEPIQKHQLIIIGGGEAYTSMEEYIGRLEGTNWDLMKKYPDWKSWLSDGLSDTVVTIKPAMPDKMNAYYPAWKIWFEKYFQYLISPPEKGGGGVCSGKLILIGHSLGGIFLAKYLSEHKFPKHISQIHLVAAVFDDEGLVGESIGTFAFNPDVLVNLEKQVPDIHIWHSTDDAIVPYHHAEKFQKYMPTATLHTFTDRGHFIQSHFVELFVQIQKSIA